MLKIVSRRLARWSLVALIIVSAGSAIAQPSPIPVKNVAIYADSGVVMAPADGDPNIAVPIYSTWVWVPHSEWLRLMFDVVVLSGDPYQGTGSYIKMTSIFDGAHQTMDVRHLADWSYSSAVFNGEKVLVELFAYPGTGGNRLSMTNVMASDGPAAELQSICGNRDDRVRSFDPRQGRLWPIGCTAWLIDRGDCTNRFLTAGHCISTSTTNAIVQFNVPLSTSDGTAVAPPPQDQFPVLNSSIQTSGSGGTGNDYAQFFTGANSITGKHARAHMGGTAYRLAGAAPTGSGQTIRITGYGTTSPNTPSGGGLPRELSLVQKTHTGPYSGLSGTRIQYAVDTTGGNSGSPVVTEADGLAIGVHTHGGCTTTGGSNSGTAVQHSGLQSYLANPRGICSPIGDVSGNGCVDDTDLALILAAFGTSGALMREDLNSDGTIDDVDLAIVLENYGVGC
ncbi:MAG: hypothetical protein HUU60_04970 [Armatimonadetes bacterium]|nr:hypothetical protein [Armatimonadota bacterium]